MRALVVTGTDTGVGKTVIAAAIAAAQLSVGRKVAVVKPAQTGVAPDEDGDLAEVRRLAGDVSLHEGVRLPDPLSPQAAARLTGTVLPTLAEQRDLVLSVAEGHDVVVIEGAGGILVPLGEAWTLLDLAECVRAEGMDVSFVVVARAGLGTLNHSGLTVHAIAARGLHVEGVVIGAWPEVPDLAEEQNLADLPVITGVPLLGRVPAGAAGLPVRQFRRGALDWLPTL